MTNVYVDREQRGTLLSYLAEHGQVRDFEVLLKRKDGSHIHVSVAAQMLFDGSGRPVGVSGTLRDISDRIEAEQALRDSEERYRSIFDNAVEGIFQADPAKGFTGVNPAMARIHGYGSPEEMLADSSGTQRRSIFVRQEDKATYLETLEKKGVVRGFETEFYRRGGDTYWASINARAVTNEKGKLLYYEGMIEDVTERRRSEEKLMLTNQRLEEATVRASEMAKRAEAASQAKSEFLANMSHEIRTPLNGVIGMTGLLLDMNLTDEQRGCAEIVRKSGETLLSLINDILDFSKIEAKKLDLEVIDFDLATVVEDTAEMLAVKAAEKGLEFTCLIHQDVPLSVRGDAGRLRQILTNLGGNAVKFTSAGRSRHLVFPSLEETEATAIVRFEVRDTGIGIPAEKQAALFSPFTQMDGSTTRKYGGTGLGLSISKQLVELMGGRIGVESEEGKGSTFRFTVVLEKQAGVAGTSKPTRRLDGVRVLVVDDHAINRLVLTEMLRSWGCRPEEAADARGAMEKLRAAADSLDPYGVALLDMCMPEENGESLGKRIKADPALRSTKMVMISSLGAGRNSEELAAIGFEGSLAKPVRQGRLHALLAAIAGDGAAHTGGRPETGPKSKKMTHHGRILLAEDNITNQLVAVKILEKLGHRVDVAANGLETIEALRNIPYDLILMDCQMPEMDGYEATGRIRSGDAGRDHRSIPIIAMTARAMQGDREKCLEAGMDDYLPKPVSASALIDVLDKWLSKEEEAVEGESEDRAAGGMAGGDAHPVLNLAEVRGLLMDSDDLVSQIIDAFIEDTRTRLVRLRTSLASGDMAGATLQFHSIKGAASSVGARRVSQGALELEAACRAGADADRVMSMLPSLEREFEEVKQVVAKMHRTAA